MANEANSASGDRYDRSGKWPILAEGWDLAIDLLFAPDPHHQV
jgi:hypothetical protein